MKMKNKKFNQKFLMSFACVLFTAILCLCSINIYNYAALLPQTSVEDTIDSDNESLDDSENVDNGENGSTSSPSDDEKNEDNTQSPSSPDGDVGNGETDDDNDEVSSQASGYWTDSGNYDANVGVYIYNAQDLAGIAYNSIEKGNTYEGRTIYIQANIDLSAHYWMPIRNFKGIIDGGGHIISGLTIDVNRDNEGRYHYGTGFLGLQSGRFIGLIGHSDGCTIKDLMLDGNISSSYEGVYGAFVSRVTGSTVKIENCVNKINIKCDSSNFGWETWMGGFVGFTDGGNVDIDNCMNLGNITRSGENVSEKVGGFVGFAKRDSQISNCINYGKISSSVKFTGGIVGSLEEGADVDHCINYGDVGGRSTGDTVTGGIVGQSGYGGSDNGDQNVTYCINVGKIKGGGTERVGSIVGWNRGNINNCYYTGNNLYGTTKAGTVNNNSKISSLSNIDIDTRYLSNFDYSSTDKSRTWSYVDFGTDEDVIEGKLVLSDWLEDINVGIQTKNIDKDGGNAYVYDQTADSETTSSMSGEAGSVYFRNGAKANSVTTNSSVTLYFFKTTNTNMSLCSRTVNSSYSFKGWYRYNSRGNYSGDPLSDNIYLYTEDGGTYNSSIQNIVAVFDRNAISYTVNVKYANQFYVEPSSFETEIGTEGGYISAVSAEASNVNEFESSENNNKESITISGLAGKYNISVSLKPNENYEVFGLFIGDKFFSSADASIVSIDNLNYEVSTSSIKAEDLKNNGGVITYTFNTNKITSGTTLTAVFVRYQYSGIKINYKLESDENNNFTEGTEGNPGLGTITVNYGYSGRAYQSHGEDIVFRNIEYGTSGNTANTISFSANGNQSAQLKIGAQLKNSGSNFFDGYYSHYVGNVTLDRKGSNETNDYNKSFAWGGTAGFTFDNFKISSSDDFIPTQNGFITFESDKQPNPSEGMIYLTLDLYQFEELGTKNGNLNVNDGLAINIHFKEFSVNPTLNRGAEYRSYYYYFADVYEDAEGVYHIGSSGGNLDIWNETDKNGEHNFNSISNSVGDITTYEIKPLSERNLYLAIEDDGTIKAGQITDQDKSKDNKYIKLDTSSVEGFEFKLTFFYEFNFDKTNPFAGSGYNSANAEPKDGQGKDLYFSTWKETLDSGEEIIKKGVLNGVTKTPNLGYFANETEKSADDENSFVDFANTFSTSGYAGSYFDKYQLYSYYTDALVNGNDEVMQSNATNYNSMLFYSYYSLQSYDINFNLYFADKIENGKPNSVSYLNAGNIICGNEDNGKSIYTVSITNKDPINMDESGQETDNNRMYIFKDVKAYSKVNIDIQKFYAYYGQNGDKEGINRFLTYYGVYCNGELLSKSETVDLQIITNNAESNVINIDVYYMLSLKINSLNLQEGNEWTVEPEKQGNTYSIDSYSDLYWMLYQTTIMGNTFEGFRFKQTCDIVFPDDTPVSIDEANEKYKDQMLYKDRDGNLYICKKENNKDIYYNIDSEFGETKVDSNISLTLSPINMLPIGTEQSPFKGYYDGQYYSIYNLNISESNLNNIGLFGYTENATIKNLTIMSGNVEGFANVGAVVGYSNNSNFTRVGNYNCSVVANTNNKNNKQIFVIEKNSLRTYDEGDNVNEALLLRNGEEISNDYTEVPMNFGGFAGVIENTDSSYNITICYSKGNISIINNASDSSTSDDDLSVGGFAGNINSNDTSFITKCYTNADKFLGNNDISLGEHCHAGELKCSSCEDEFIW